MYNFCFRKSLDRWMKRLDRTPVIRVKSPSELRGFSDHNVQQFNRKTNEKKSSSKKIIGTLNQRNRIHRTTNKSTNVRVDESKLVIPSIPNKEQIKKQESSSSKNVTGKKNLTERNVEVIVYRNKIMESNVIEKSTVSKQSDTSESFDSPEFPEIENVSIDTAVLYTKLENGNYSCDICEITCDQKNKIERHIVGKHSFHRPFQCTACSKSFKYKCDLKAHMLVHTDLDSTRLHRCDKCDYVSKVKNNLKAHYTRKHTDDFKFSCEQCGKRFKMEWDLKFHIATHQNSEHMCDICGQFYKSDYSLNKHRRVSHLNNYKFQCSKCHKRLLTQENLDNHMLGHSVTYDCKECGKSFASKRYLTTHSSMHTGIKRFSCNLCEKVFRTAQTRNAHRSTHSEARPYMCDLCGQNFKRRYYMLDHRKKHPDAHLSPLPIPLGKDKCPSPK